MRALRHIAAFEYLYLIIVNPLSDVYEPNCRRRPV